jgi:primosomal protein N' (replication factor Y)
MSPPISISSFAIDLPVYHCFDYRVSATTMQTPGQRYLVPFGQLEKVAVLVGPANQSHQHAGKIKTVITQLDIEPTLSSHIIALAQWIASYYCQPLPEALFHCLPRYCRSARTIKPTGLHYWMTSGCDAETLTALQRKAPRQHELFQALSEHPSGLNGTQLRALNPGWSQQLKGLESKGLVSKQWRENIEQAGVSRLPGPELTVEQQKIIRDIAPQLHAFQVQLIHGVTGSGKTEIYLELMQRVIASGKQVIYLVPEIGLTPQLLERLQQRLQGYIVSSHSGQADFQRYQGWDQFKRGVAQVMIGTRSALFSDCPALGLIIVDEEHDSSYRQQDGLRYHARDVAIKRAQMLDIPIILGSATPSIESLHNLQKPYFHLHQLLTRPNKSSPPNIQLIDCKHIALNNGCSAALLKTIQRHLHERGQVLLYLNRRGYAPVVMCHDCDWQAGCYQCDARLTLHQSVNRLICHHCGYSTPAPENCPECGAKEIFHYGVGTQQLESFLRERFPQIPVIRIDRDSVSAAHPLEQKLEPLRNSEPCILIGTQMLAKGHDYPNISLVGILDVDQALFSSFYRAPERLIQTVLQVSGRAGRAHKGGEACLQTAFPTHPLMQNLCTQGYSQLVQPLLEERKLLGFPPYARVVTFIVDAYELTTAMKRLQQLKQDIDGLQPPTEVQVIGPIPALMARRVGRYRAQLSILAANIQPLRELLHKLMPIIIKTGNTKKSRLVVDVDPVDL